MAFAIRNSLTSILIKTLSKKGYDIPSLYFDESMQEQLSKEDFELFSKFLEKTNRLIDIINELPVDDSFKISKCEDIKNKIHKATNVSTILEYYIEFEVEFHKIEKNLNEYSFLKDIVHSINIHENSVTIDTLSKTVIPEPKNIKTCDSVVKDGYSIDADDIKSINKDEFETTEDLLNLDFDKDSVTYDFYVEKYSKSYNISKSKVKEILKHVYL